MRWYALNFGTGMNYNWPEFEVEHALFVSLVTPYLQFPSSSPISPLSFLSSFSSSVLSPSFSTSIFFLLPHPTLLFSSLNLGKLSLSMNYVIWYQEYCNEPVQLTYSTFVSNNIILGIRVWSANIQSGQEYPFTASSASHHINHHRSKLFLPLKPHP